MDTNINYILQATNTKGGSVASAIFKTREEGLMYLKTIHDALIRNNLFGHVNERYEPSGEEIISSITSKKGNIYSLNIMDGISLIDGLPIGELY